MRKFSLIAAILEKDFLDSIKNRIVFFALIFPVILSIIFQLVLSPGRMPKLKIAVINAPDDELEKFFNTRSMGRLSAVRMKSFDKAKKLIKDGKIHAALVLPDNFQESLEKGKSPMIDFWVDTGNLSRAAALESAVSKLLYHYNNRKPPVELVMRSVQGQNFNPRVALLPTWLLFTLLGGFMVVASSIIEERERKTLQAILVTPCRLSEILIGKGLLGFLLTITAAILILSLNKGFVGNVASTFLIILCGAGFFAVLGVFLGLVLPGQTSANSFGSILYVGLFLPVVLADVNSYMKMVAKLLPSFYVDDGLRNSLFSGVPPGRMLSHFTYLLVFGAVLFVISTVVLRKKESL